jgi:hypothetical protein
MPGKSSKKGSKARVSQYEDVEVRQILKTKEIWEAKHKESGQTCFRLVVDKDTPVKKNKGKKYVYAPVQFWIECERWAFITIKIAGLALTGSPSYKIDPEEEELPKQAEICIRRIDNEAFEDSNYTKVHVDKDDLSSPSWAEDFTRVNNELWEALEFIDTQFMMYVAHENAKSKKNHIKRDLAPESRLRSFYTPTTQFRTPTRRLAKPSDDTKEEDIGEHGYVDIPAYHRLAMPVYRDEYDRKYHGTLVRKGFGVGGKRTLQEYVFHSSKKTQEMQPYRWKSKKPLKAEDLRSAIPRFSAVNINYAINSVAMTGAFISLKGEVRMLDLILRHPIVRRKVKNERQAAKTAQLQSALGALEDALDEEESDEDENEELDSDAEDEPRRKKKFNIPADDSDDEEEEEAVPKRGKKSRGRKSRNEEAPKKKKRKVDSDDEEDEEEPKKKSHRGKKKSRKPEPEPESEEEEEEMKSEDEEPKKKSRKEKKRRKPEPESEEEEEEEVDEPAKDEAEEDDEGEEEAEAEEEEED